MNDHDNEEIADIVAAAERRVLERVREKLPKQKYRPVLNVNGEWDFETGFNQAIQKVDDILKELTPREEDK